MTKKIGRTGITAFVAALIAVLCFVFFAPVASEVVAEEAQTKAIDMYLIAGQSNAAGYSNNVTDAQSFSNVMYAGEINKNRTTGATAQSCVSSFSAFKKSVTVGLGRSGAHMGPEYGMAKILNGLYSGDTKAIIFKSAAGGTALRDVQSGESNTWGNWYPRSRWANGFTPNGATSPTGVQYKNFVDNFTQVYNILVAQGYTPKVKGMVWMQGCADLGAHTEYEGLLKTFIADIRTDLKTVTGDNDLDDMPFVIGEIATSFSYQNNTNVPPFNTVQRKVATDMEHVYTVPTADLIINDASGVVGTDRYHFNAADAETLGTRFAEKIVGDRESLNVNFEYNDNQGIVRVGMKKVTDTYKVLSGDSLTIKVLPKVGYQIDKVLFNNSEVEYNTTEKAYIIGPITENNGTVKVTFAEKPAEDSTTDGAGTDNKTDEGKDDGSNKSDGNNGGGCGGKDVALAFALISSLAAAVLILKK